MESTVNSNRQEFIEKLLLFNVEITISVLLYAIDYVYKWQLLMETMRVSSTCIE